MTEKLDAVIVGGGVAGLWILHRLRHHGLNVRLYDSGASQGQTANSQGILHRGTKYLLRPTEGTVQRFPDLLQRWRACLDGENAPGDPDLSTTRVVGEGLDLLSNEPLPEDLVDRLEWAQERGLVEYVRGRYRFCEPVLDPRPLLANLEQLHASSIIKVAAPTAELTQSCRWLILAAGAGNEPLLNDLGLHQPVMIRRPLHLVWAYGALPPTFCHVLDSRAAPGRPGAHWTVTSRQENGKYSWYLGGDFSEAERSPEEQQDLVRRLLRRSFPDVEVNELKSFHIDRAEPQPTGPRSLQPFLHRQDGPPANAHVLTVWPMKLVLAPLLADRVAAEMGL